MKDIESSKKESPLLGLTGMGGGVGGFNFLAAAGGAGLWAWGVNKRDLFMPSPAPTTPATTQKRSSPVQIGTDTNWTLFQMGSQADGYAAINSDKELYTWGTNQQGLLGQNQHSGKKALPDVSAFPGTWKDMSIAMGSMCGLKDDNTLWVWGENRNGHLGINNGSYNGPSSPTQIPGTWAVAVFGGSDQHVSGMGVKTDGTLWTWGKNAFGKLGFSSPSYAQEGASRYSSPVQVGTDTTWGKEKGLISMGDEAAFAIKTNGTLWAWGNGWAGMLGDGVGNSNAANTSPKQIGTNTNWASIVASGYGYDRCVAVKTNNTMWTWGQNEIGILGLNTRAPNIEGRSSPTQIPGTNWTIGGGNSLGVKDTAWVKEDGTLWVWGYNSNGSLGLNQGPGNERSSPTQLGTSTDWLGGTGGQENLLGGWGPRE
jgi:alpha-tubulin suppressor-like RCC1 family protein